MRGLQHFQYGAQRLSAQPAFQPDDLASRHAGVFGIATIKSLPYAPRHGHDLLPQLELPARTCRDNADCFNARHLPESPARCQPQPCVKLRPVDAERCNADQHSAGAWRGYRQSSDLQCIWRAWCLESDRDHALHGCFASE